MTTSDSLVPVSGVHSRCCQASLWILSFFFLCGCIAGCFLGGSFFSFGTSEEFLMIDEPMGSFNSWLYVLWPIILVLFFSSSLYGWLLIPSLFLARGVSAASAAALMIAAGGSRTPAVLFSYDFLPLCALFAAGEWSFICSYCLFRSYEPGFVHMQAGSSRRLLYIIILSLLSALLRRYIVPSMI